MSLIEGFEQRATVLRPRTAARNTIVPPASTVGLTVRPDKATTGALDVQIVGESFARTRIVPGGLQVGPGTGALDATFSRGAAVGTGVSTFNQDGRRFDRTGWANARDWILAASFNTTTDVVAALDAMLDALDAAGGGVAYLPKALYTVGSTVEIPSNVTLKGDGMGRTIIRAAAAMGNDTVVENKDVTNGNDNITVEDLTVDGNRANRTATAGHVLSFNGGTTTARNERVTIRDVEVTGGELAGIVCTNCAGLVISGCEVWNCERDGIAVYYNSSGVRITDNFIYDCGDDYVALNSELTNSTGHLLTNAVVSNNMMGPSPVLSANQGIVVRGGERIILSGNVIYQGDSAGIWINPQNTTVVRNVTITGNAIYDSGAAGGTGYGIAFGPQQFSGAGVANMTNVTISGNAIERSRGPGIFAWMPEAGATVQDLIVTGNVIKGMGASGGSATADGIALIPTNSTLERVLVTGNSISESARNGIRVQPSGGGVVQRLTITGNQVWSNGKQTTAAGVRLSGIDNCVVTGNRSGDSPTAVQTYGLELATITGTNLLTNNDLTGNLTGQLSTSALSSGTQFADAVVTAKTPVRAASVGDITTTAPGATIDGVTMVANDRVLLKDQTTESQNGVWVWNGAAVAMTRAADADEGYKMRGGAQISVEEGTKNKDTGWLLVINGVPTIGSTTLRFSRTQPAYARGADLDPWATSSAISETFQREHATTAVLLTDNRLFFAGGCVIPANRTVTNVNLYNTAVGSAIVSFWIAIIRQADRVCLQRTANSTSLPTINAVHTRALQATYTSVVDVPVYVVIGWDGTTVSQWAGSPAGQANLLSVAPILSAESSVAPTTTPPAVGAALAAPAVTRTQNIYAFLT